jgi:hypothetical protein
VRDAEKYIKVVLMYYITIETLMGSGWISQPINSPKKDLMSRQLVGVSVRLRIDRAADLRVLPRQW